MKQYAIGIDVGGTNIKFGLVKFPGMIIARTRLSTKKYIRSRQALIRAIIGKIKELHQSKGLKRENIQGIGFGLPGLINPIKGIVNFLPNIPGWCNVPLKRIVQQKTGIKTFLDNDANLIALAEWKLGAGRGYKNLLCITLGTGVGGGLILDSHLYRGEGFVAGEVGHIPYKNSVLEKYVGNTSLLKKARKIFRKSHITLEEIFALANKRNARAKRLWQEMGIDLGIVLAGVINLINPPLIVVGGGVSNNFKFIAPTLRRTLKCYAMEVQSRMVKVVRATLGDDSGILGASLLVKEPRFV